MTTRTMATSGKTTRTSRPTPRALAALAITAGLLLGACSDDGEEGGDEQTSQEPTAQEVLDRAAEVLVEAGTVSLSLTGEDLPDEVTSLIVDAEGSGTMDPPAFEGTITARLAGISANVPTIAVDGSLYVQLPYTPTMVETDPASLNVPDPANLFDPETGLVGLLGQTEDAEFGGESRVGSDVVQEISGSLPGQAVTDLLLVGDSASAFAVTYGVVEESEQVRTVRLTGPFYPPAESTYLVTLDDYGAPVTITAP